MVELPSLAYLLSSMTDNISPLADLRRLRAALALRCQTVSDLAHKLGCTPSHLRLVLLGRREISMSLRSRLEHQLGDEEWSFVRGRTNVLRDESHGRVSKIRTKVAT